MVVIMNTLDLPLLVLLFFLFFSYAVVTLQFIFPISALFIVSLLIYVKITKTIIISKDDLFWLSCTTVNFVGLIRTPNFSSAILFTGFLLIFVLLKIYLSMMTNWTSFFIRTSLVFSSVHVVSTITQYFIPGFIQALNQIILPSAAYSVNMYQLKVSKYAGITGQVGANSFYITIFLAVIFSSLMIKKRRFLLVLIFMLGFIALLLTTKRGLLLFNSIAILYLFFLVNLGRSKKNKKAIVISLILLVTISVFSAAIYLISNPSIATKILVDDDITSGRIGIY